MRCLLSGIGMLLTVARGKGMLGWIVVGSSEIDYAQVFETGTVSTRSVWDLIHVLNLPEMQLTFHSSPSTIGRSMSRDQV